MSDRPSDIKVDLHNAVIALKGVTTEWYTLGLSLGLPDFTLKLICSNHPRDAESCLRTMLSNWLSYDTQASWERLAKALAAMGQNVIATNIRSKFVTAATVPVDEISDDDKTCMFISDSFIPHNYFTD